MDVQKELGIIGCIRYIKVLINDITIYFMALLLFIYTILFTNLPLYTEGRKVKQYNKAQNLNKN